MTKFIGLIFFLLLVASCGDNEVAPVEIKEGDNFTISGTVVGAGNQSFYLEAISQEGNISIANSKANIDGHFEMTGNIPGFGMYQLRLGEQNDKIIPLTIVPKDKVVISADIGTYISTPNISGTEWGKIMTEYMSKFSKFHEDQNELMALKGKLSNGEITERFLELKSEVDAFAINAMKNDPGNPFNIVLSASATPTMGFQNWSADNLDVLYSVSEAYEKKFANSPLTATLSNQIYQIDVAYKKYVAENSGKKSAPEISMSNPDGETMSLSSLRGQYVLIDFWASWCGPCRSENPNLVKVYNQYKDKGFTVFSVSLDKNLDKWKEAIKKDNLSWPNHVSDLKQWNTPMTSLYNFSSIPHTVLVNPEGKIIATGLRGKSLEQKLKELL